MDEMIRQLVALSSKVAILEAERPRTTRAETQNPTPEVRGLPNGVIAPAPPSFHGTSDGDTVKNCEKLCRCPRYLFQISGHEGLGLEGLICLSFTRG